MRRRILLAVQLCAAMALVIGVIAGAESGYADRDDKERPSSSEAELERSQKESREFAGQVLEINTLVDPPELVVSVQDGDPMRVKVFKKDEIARNGIRLGDYVSGLGEKVHEQLFEADQLFVDARFDDNDNE